MWETFWLGAEKQRVEKQPARKQTDKQNKTKKTTNKQTKDTHIHICEYTFANTCIYTCNMYIYM